MTIAMTELLELKKRLIEAEGALHQLLTGTREVTVSVGGFGATSYAQANISELRQYISELKSAIAAKEGKARRGPIFMRF